MQPDDRPVEVLVPVLQAGLVPGDWEIFHRDNLKERKPTADVDDVIVSRSTMENKYLGKLCKGKSLSIQDFKRIHVGELST